MLELDFNVNWPGRPFIWTKINWRSKFCINRDKVLSFYHHNSSHKRKSTEICALLRVYWLKFWCAPLFGVFYLQLASILVKSFGNLMFSWMIILGEVSKICFCHYFWMVMVYFLAHNKDYEIACLINPRSEELKSLLLHFVFVGLCLIGLYWQTSKALKS